MMQPIYHITSQQDAKMAEVAGKYESATFAEEGFIHCSYLEQIIEVANRYYRGSDDLVLLEIDRSLLACHVVDENLVGGNDRYPHVYGPVSMAAVRRVYSFPSNADGSFDLPQALSK